MGLALIAYGADIYHQEHFTKTSAFCTKLSEYKRKGTNEENALLFLVCYKNTKHAIGPEYPEV